jgi:hypothetical protein
LTYTNGWTEADLLGSDELHTRATQACCVCGGGTTSHRRRSRYLLRGAN